MNTTQAVNEFEQKIVEAINGCRLHPAIVRLVLINVLHVVQDKERELQNSEEGAANG